MSLNSLPDLFSDRNLEIYLNGLTSSDFNIRFDSANSLRKIFADNSSVTASLSEKERAIDPMIEALSFDDAPMRCQIIWGLEYIGENAIKALIKATQNKVEEVRTPSIHALGKYISFPGLRFRALATLIHDEKIEIRQSASSAINCFAQRIGMAKENWPTEITPEHQMISEELKCLLRNNLESEELKIPQFTQQALNLLDKSFSVGWVEECWRSLSVRRQPKVSKVLACLLGFATRNPTYHFSRFQDFCLSISS